MTRWLALALPFGLLACNGGEYGDADITGTIGDITLGNDLTVYHGTRHIVIVDRKMECLDMAWVTRNYFAQEASSGKPFAALQFTFDSETPEIGTFTLTAGEGAVTAWRLLNLDPGAEPPYPPIDFDRARDGTMTLDVANENEVSGAFDVVFGDSAAGGVFTSVPCRNVR